MNKIAFSAAVVVVALGSLNGAQAQGLNLIGDLAGPTSISDWDGPFVGGGPIFQTSSTAVEQVVGLQGTLGYNVLWHRFVAGGRVFVSPWWSTLVGFGGSGGIQARAGFLPADDVLVYGSFGREFSIAGFDSLVAGGGVEILQAENLSLDFEYKYYLALNAFWEAHHFGVSANWHF